MQSNPWTMRVSARDHFKSFSVYAHFMWTLYKTRRQNLECQYYSYKAELASYHIAKIKQLIAASPAFEDCIDLKKRAESVCSYMWRVNPGERSFKVTMEPGGLLSFKRGQHPNGPVYIDDPLRDPENKLDPTSIKKINNIFKFEILPIPQNELHVVGTVQTDQDFFFDTKLRLQPSEQWSRKLRRFRVVIHPAVISFTDKVARFPEWKSFEELMNIRDRDGDKVFNQEYMCMPAYSEDSFLPQEIKLDPVIVPPGWQGVDKLSYKAKLDCVGGYDIGKKTHPAHFTVWEDTGEYHVVEIDGEKQEMPIRRVIYQKFFDGMDYSDQVETVATLIRQLGIDKVYYDATRGELEGFDEIGMLPPELEGVAFSIKSKTAMANVLYREVTRKRLSLIDDTRFINQLLVVNNDLQAIESPEGHGDSFWSLALSLYGLTLPQPRIR